MKVPLRISIKITIPIENFHFGPKFNNIDKQRLIIIKIPALGLTVTLVIS